MRFSNTAKVLAIAGLTALHSSQGVTSASLDTKSYLAPCKPAGSTDPALRNYRTCSELFAFTDTSGAFLGSGTYGKFEAGQKAQFQTGATNLSIGQQIHQRIAQQIELLYGWGATVDPLTNSTGEESQKGYYGIDIALGQNSADSARLSKLARVCNPCKPSSSLDSLGGKFLEKEEKTENHAGESCGVTADVTVDMSGKPTFHLNDQVGTLEIAYFKGARVQALSCFYGKIMKEITQAAQSGRPSISVTEGCIAQAEDFFSSSTSAATCQQSGVGDDARFSPMDRCFEQLGKPIDVAACPKEETEQTGFDASYSDQGQRKISCQKIRATRGALEAGFAMVAKCEIAGRAERAYRSKLGDSDLQKAMILKINGIVYPTCNARCAPLAPNFAAINQCATDCWAELAPPKIKEEIEKLWPSDGDGCTEAGFSLASFLIAFSTLLSSLVSARRRRRVATVVASCVLAVCLASNLSGCGGGKNNSGNDNNGDNGQVDNKSKDSGEPDLSAANKAETDASQAIADQGQKSIADMANLKAPDASGTSFTPSSPAPTINNVLGSTDPNSNSAAALAATSGYQIPTGVASGTTTTTGTPVTTTLAPSLKTQGGTDAAGKTAGGGSFGGGGVSTSSQPTTASVPTEALKVTTDSGLSAFNGGGSAGGRSLASTDYGLGGSGSSASGGSNSGTLAFAGDSAATTTAAVSGQDDPRYFQKLGPDADLFKEVSQQIGIQVLRWEQEKTRKTASKASN